MSSPRATGPRRALRIGGWVLAVAALAVVQAELRPDQRPTVAAAEGTPTAASDVAGPGPMVEVDPADPALTALAEAEAERETLAVTAAKGHQTPFVTTVGTGPDAAATLVVPRRDAPYDMAEIARLAPGAFDHLLDGSLVLLRPMVVAPEAQVTIDSATVPRLLLASDATVPASIRAVRASLTFVGRADARLAVSSWDRATGAPDEDRTDGRAYITERSGVMTFARTDVSYLGYATTGLTSGVAWIGTDDRPTGGGTEDSTFTHNYFGAYTANAIGLQIVRSAFNDNVVYGFDPHTATNDTVVEHSVAARNGRHGFIFSEGCVGNVVRDSEAYLNGGNGFVIDDGTPAHGQGRDSDDNSLVRVFAHENGRDGIVIEGGARNTVESSTAADNRTGIWVRNQATETQLVGNQVSSSEANGVRLGEGLGTTLVADTDIAVAATGLMSEGGSATTVVDLAISGTDVGMSLRGDQSQASFAGVSIAEGTPTGVAVTGTGLADGAMAGVDAPSPARSSSWWSAHFLHETLVSLWVLILLVPTVALAVSALGRRRRRPAGT